MDRARPDAPDAPDAFAAPGAPGAPGACVGADTLGSPTDGALLLVLTTVATRDQALALARAVLDRHLAACVQLQAIESLYHWQGALQCEPEQRLLLKTTQAAWPALQALLRGLHPYSLPALLAVPVAAVDADFAHGVREESRGDGG